MQNFEAHDFYLLRTPLLSVDKLMEFNDKIIHGSKEALEENLRELFSEAILQEAIYIASPDFYAEFKKWFDGVNQNPSDVRKILLSLYKYYVRMSTRCTPYGLFAGCTIGDIQDSTDIRFAENAKFRKSSRLDMNYVEEVAKLIVNREEIRHQLLFFTNSSIYQVADAYRYAECRVQHKKRSCFLTSVAFSEYLESILTKAKNGARLSELAQSIVSNEVNYNEAIAFVEDMIDAQILVSELEPTTTGDEFFDVLMARMVTLQGTAEISKHLQQIKRLLLIQDNSVSKYHEIERIISENFVKTSSKDLIQTDLFYETLNNSIGKTVTKQLSSSLEKLFLWTRKNNGADLESFKKRFYARYEEEEVPLLLALDGETGVGYGAVFGGQADNAPLVDDLRIQGRAREQTTNWEDIDRIKFSKFLQAKQEGSTTIMLTDKDFEPFLAIKDGIKLPDSFYAFGSVLAPSAEAIDTGNFKFLMSVASGPSAGNLFARFCHGDEKITAKVKECLEYEEQHNPEAIYAEVVHLPEARIGNILMRPAIRKYEIPFLGNASVEKPFQIALDDLMVSVPYGRKVVLRSKKLNKEVIPRLTTAHNYSRGLGIYKFLCDLQGYGLNSTVSWDWGILNEQTFLPRVEYKNIIVSKAKWKLYAELHPALAGKNLPDRTFWDNLQKDLNIPRYVVLTEGDNELLIDFESETSLQILHHKILKKGMATLSEFLSSPDNCFIQDKNGKYSNEMLLAFKTLHVKKREMIPKRIDSNVRRIFVPGSEWFYVKIYTGTKSIEKILTKIVKPLCEELVNDGVIDKWFFLRFKDTDEHLRLRFHNGKNAQFWQYILTLLHEKLAPYIDQKIVNSIQIDTYKREIERYGDTTIEQCEQLFYHDSQAIVNFIDLLDGSDEGEKYRYLFGLYGVNALLDDFEFSLTQKAELLKNLQAGFFQEFNGNNALNVQLNDKYRLQTSAINQLMNGNEFDEGVADAIAIFKERSAENRKIVAEIREIQANQTSVMTFQEMLPSLIHMYLNRLFISKQRLHELVIYHYLDKYYKSQIARKKQHTVLINS
ncbi:MULTISPECIES: lantibiotic dehydratase [unclassified Arcicella]|uniref:lantibiotic dehydratase n=1 Tax=unclassified Arcicella TaxID=2644986 RepID=UPI002866EF1C|nr:MULTISPECIES: lantibiotic dehydratase [unclassified Arcicella]MDR6562160.1 thiopeptide-type bacteriocin biosynthesis protein [Arcicella sp. BE51]MDR6812145.1 thiopeptide-type bacteriocin biosynthesis protein [Arcicella sp. BE140]MDR6823457.1 thiopeptide-type bacteriocin biosynthesis protein [Arcicella sp. BE139]